MAQCLSTGSTLIRPHTRMVVDHLLIALATRTNSSGYFEFISFCDKSAIILRTFQIQYISRTSEEIFENSRFLTGWKENFEEIRWVKVFIPSYFYFVLFVKHKNVFYKDKRQMTRCDKGDKAVFEQFHQTCWMKTSPHQDELCHCSKRRDFFTLLTCRALTSQTSCVDSEPSRTRM